MPLEHVSYVMSGVATAAFKEGSVIDARVLASVTDFDLQPEQCLD